LKSTQEYGPARRGWLAAVLAAGVAASSGPGITRAAETHTSKGYYPLVGAAAWRFLIGNTVWAPPVEANSGAGRSAEYFADENTELGGERNGGACSVDAVTFHADSWCSKLNMLESHETCFKDHVIVSRSVDIGKAKTGDLIGYLYPTMDFLPGSGIGDEEPSPDNSLAILKGNVTGCPRLGAPQPANPLELPAAGGLVPSNSAKNLKASPGSVISRLLIGNSVLWPSSRDLVSTPGYDGSVSRQYYSPDGYAFRADYDRSWKIFSVAQSRWKIINGRFCLQDWDNHRAFSACDPITILSIPAPSGSVRLHAYFDESLEGAAPNPGAAQPGLIEKGNPVGFVAEKP